MVKQTMQLASARSGLGAISALCLLLLGACGDKEPTQTTNPGAGGGSGGSGRGGSGGQSSRTGGSGPSAGGGGQAASNGGSTGADAAPGGETNAGGGDYFPFAVGTSWEYDVTETGLQPYKKLHTIVRAEAVGGTGPHKAAMALRVETRKSGGVGGMDATVSWQGRLGNKVVRYREYACSANSLTIEGGSVSKCTLDVEDHWDPPRVRLDEKPKGMDPAAGPPWPETYTEFKAKYSYALNPAMPTITNTMVMQTDTWEVKQVGATVTTPAGTFNNCLVIQKTSSTERAKVYSFCKGVGKVKEEGTGQVEILSKYTVK